MVRGAFALGLIFARNPNPDAHVLRRIILKTIFLHSTTSRKISKRFQAGNFYFLNKNGRYWLDETPLKYNFRQSV
jgi:hypothetical protein